MPSGQLEIVDLEELAGVTGTVVVIDVLRAFTTAAVALARGAASIEPVSTVAQAFDRRREDPGMLLLGEEGGLPIDGFDLPNSPTAVATAELGGARLVQRTTAGTQGLVRATTADALFAASFANAAATVAAVARCRDRDVTFVVTGSHTADRGDDDRACAEYLARTVGGDEQDPAPYLRRVRGSAAASKFLDPEQPRFPAADVDACTRVDRVGFAMPVSRDAQRLTLHAAAG